MIVTQNRTAFTACAVEAAGVAEKVDRIPRPPTVSLLGENRGANDENGVDADGGEMRVARRVVVVDVMA